VAAFENTDYIMAVGIYRPLDDSLRIAFHPAGSLIHEDYGLSEMDAYELLSKVAEIHLDQMVDPNTPSSPNQQEVSPAAQVGEVSKPRSGGCPRFAPAYWIIMSGFQCFPRRAQPRLIPLRQTKVGLRSVT